MNDASVVNLEWSEAVAATPAAPALPSAVRIRRPGPGYERLIWLSAAIAGLLVSLATIGIFTAHATPLPLLTTSEQAGVEAAAGFASLFAALVLFLFPADKVGQGLRWVGTGILVLGFRGVLFDNPAPLLHLTHAANGALYLSIMLQILGTGLCAAGLFLRGPRFSTYTLVGAVIAGGMLCLAVVTAANWLPPLINDPPDWTVASKSVPLSHLTPWHWMLSIVPLAIAGAALSGTVRRIQSQEVGEWMLAGMVIVAGMQLHHIFLPAIYSPALTGGDLLRLGATAVIAFGATLELRRTAAERAELLKSLQERTERLSELAILKADFSAMVAHELGSPVAAIRGLADMLATKELGPAEQARILEAVRGEVDMINTLVGDVRVAASMEREDFSIHPMPLPLSSFVSYAETFFLTLPGNIALNVPEPRKVVRNVHGDTPLVVPTAIDDVVVMADYERICQVLRNLLNNAVKYSPDGARVELRITLQEQKVRLEVADSGMGIEPDQLKRIFEKFGRGRDAQGRKIPGVGLGLYLSRRIVQAHGSDITVQSAPGVGSVFGFELEVL